MEDKATQTTTHSTRRGYFNGLKKARKILFGSGALSLILLLAIAAAVFFAWKWRDTQNQIKHPEAAAKAEASSLVSQLSKLTVLPAGEQPTVATVSDVSKLAGQSFFANAKNGDKVLIYSQAKKAYLYRPSTNQIINIAPLNINSGTNSSSSNSTKKP